MASDSVDRRRRHSAIRPIAGLLAAQPPGSAFELQRFIIRSGNLIVLSAILIWFGLRRRFSTGALMADRGDEIGKEEDTELQAALRHSKRVLKAKFGLALWTKNGAGEQKTFTARAKKFFGFRSR